MNCPKTLFSTSLSGSVRTTEERIRNIFRHSKRRPPVLAVILAASCILLCGSLVSCQTKAGSSTPPASSTNQNDDEFTVYKYHDFSVAIPNQFLDQLIVNEGSPTRNGNEVIVTVHEKASVEAGKADGMEDGLGLLFNIVCFDRTEYEAILADDMGVGGITFFAKNEDTCFAWGKSTDVQLYRDNGVLSEDDFETWTTLSAMSTTVQREFISRNNLQPINSDELWNPQNSLLGLYHNLSAEQMEMIDGAISHPDATLTQNGVTISVKETFSDTAGLYVLYEVTVPEHLKLDNTVRWKINALFPPMPASSTMDSMTLNWSENKRTELIYAIYSSPFKSGKVELYCSDLGYFDSPEQTVPLVEGKWNLKWDFTYTNIGQTFDVDLPLVMNGTNNTITQVAISPISVCLYITGDNILESVQPTVTLKDGSQMNFTRQDSNTKFSYYQDYEDTSYTNQLYCRFNNVIDMDDIASIQIGDVVIPLE